MFILLHQLTSIVNHVYMMFLLKVSKSMEKNTEAITGRYTSHRCHLDRSRKPTAGFRWISDLEETQCPASTMRGFVWIGFFFGFWGVHGCTKFRTLRLETSALMRSEEKSAVPFSDTKRLPRFFSGLLAVSQVSGSTKHDRVTIPKGEISLANREKQQRKPAATKLYPKFPSKLRQEWHSF